MEMNFLLLGHMNLSYSNAVRFEWVMRKKGKTPVFRSYAWAGADVCNWDAVL